MTETRSLTDEDRMLDEAIVQATPILAESLMREEHTRRRKRRWIAGAVAMTLMIAAVGFSLSLLGADPSTTPQTPTTEVAQTERLTQRGWSLWRERRYATAAETFEQAVAEDPQDINAWNGLGWSRFNGGLGRASATEAFKRCIELSPDHPAALNGLGQIALAEGRLDEAKQWLLQAAPQAPAAWFGLTQLYLLKGDWEQAEQWASKIVAENPDNVFAQQLLEAAKTKTLTLQLKQSIEPSPELKEEGVSPAAVISQQGWALWMQRKLPEAEQAFHQAIEVDPDYLPAQNGMGWALLNQGKRAEAMPYFERCLAMEPEHLGAMNGLAICLKARGDVDEAIAIWKRGLEIAPQPNALMSGLAQTYLERKQYAEALPLLEQLAEADPTNQGLQSRLKLAREKTVSQND